MNYRRQLDKFEHARGEQRNAYAGHNMPGVEEKDRYDDPENICREQRHDECKEESIRVNVRDFECMCGCLDLN